MTSEAARFVPKYFAIEQSSSGPDSALCSQATPCPATPSSGQEFDVSRMTAGRPSLPCQEGLLYRAQGRGTFVAQPPVPRGMGGLLSFSEEMRRRGFTPASRVLDAGPVPLSEDERTRLRATGGRGVLVRRVRLADEAPVAVERDLLPWHCHFVLDADLATASLHQLLTNGWFSHNGHRHPDRTARYRGKTPDSSP